MFFTGITTIIRLPPPRPVPSSRSTLALLLATPLVSALTIYFYFYVLHFQDGPWAERNLWHLLAPTYTSERILSFLSRTGGSSRPKSATRRRDDPNTGTHLVSFSFLHFHWSLDLTYYFWFLFLLALLQVPPPRITELKTRTTAEVC